VWVGGGGGSSLLLSWWGIRRRRLKKGSLAKRTQNIQWGEGRGSIEYAYGERTMNPNRPGDHRIMVAWVALSTWRKEQKNNRQVSAFKPSGEGRG